VKPTKPDVVIIVGGSGLAGGGQRKIPLWRACHPVPELITSDIIDVMMKRRRLADRALLMRSRGIQNPARRVFDAGGSATTARPFPGWQTRSTPSSSRAASPSPPPPSASDGNHRKIAYAEPLGVTDGRRDYRTCCSICTAARLLDVLSGRAHGHRIAVRVLIRRYPSRLGASRSGVLSPLMSVAGV